MDKDERSQFFSRLSIILFGIASAALVITIYHCINVSNWSNHRGSRRRRQRLPQTFRSEQVGTPSSVENSMVQLIIPAHKYEKGVGLAGGEVDGTCAVCLSEFEEGEDVRTLPECLHSFHVPCIDMWLYSHSNCPMCRTQATPSPQILIHQFPEYASGGPPETQLESGMLPAIIVQSRIL